MNIQLAQLGYKSRIRNVSIKTEHIGRVITNCHVQYLRSLKVRWSSRVVRGYSWKRTYQLDALIQFQTRLASHKLLTHSIEMLVIHNAIMPQTFQVRLRHIRTTTSIQLTVTPIKYNLKCGNIYYKAFGEIPIVYVAVTY